MLTDNQRRLLREAIFDSFFEAEYGVLSKELFESIDKLDDDVILEKLSQYTSIKEAEKQAKIIELEAELNKLKGE